jgi:hypothetical protein
MNQLFISRCAIATGLALTLFGCGGDEDGNAIAPPPTEVFPVVAMDGFSVAALDTPTFIDLAPYVRGGQAALTSVSYSGVNADECSLPTQQGMGFTVTPLKGVLCDYQFTVSNAQVSDNALMKVFTTQAVDPILPALSHPMVLEGTPTPVALNLVDLLNETGQWPEEYDLNPESVTVQGSAGNIGGVTAYGNTIAYTAPTAAGWNRIIYTLSNASDPGQDRMGTIYVTISDAVNTPPLIGKVKYDYNTENGNQVVYTGDSIEINLASFVTEPDGHDWQLIEVQSYTATAVPQNPNVTTNQIIRFSAGTVGEHIISYVVADHFGGYSFGIVKVTVSAKEHAANWEALSVGGTLYMAPLRYSDGVNTGFSVTPQWDNLVNNTIAGYNVNSAKTYCSTVGSVPTVSEMTALRNAHYTAPAATGELNKWPAAKPYLVRNDANTEYLGYNVTTGTSEANQSGMYYVTCIENHNINITVLTREVVANDKVVTIATINKPASMDVEITSVAVPGWLGEDDVNMIVTGSGNRLTVTTKSIKAGAYSFKVTNILDVTDSVSSQMINYIGDEKTAALASFTVDINDAKAGNVEANKLTATILDVNSNPVASQQISITLQENGTAANSASLVNTALFTNVNGHVSVSVKNSEIETVDVTANYAGYAGIDDSNRTERIRFVNNPLYCHQFAGVINLNCLPTITSASGKMFTASMSKQFRDASYPDVSYDSMSIENGNYGNKGEYILTSHPQSLALCAAYNTENQYERNNWRLATRDELQTELLNTFDKTPLFTAMGWPTWNYYWSSTPVGPHYYYVSVGSGHVHSDAPHYGLYASCVSDPEG